MTLAARPPATSPPRKPAGFVATDRPCFSRWQCWWGAWQILAMTRLASPSILMAPWTLMSLTGYSPTSPPLWVGLQPDKIPTMARASARQGRQGTAIPPSRTEVRPTTRRGLSIEARTAPTQPAARPPPPARGRAGGEDVSPSQQRPLAPPATPASSMRSDIRKWLSSIIASRLPRPRGARALLPRRASHPGHRPRSQSPPLKA
jgi:hypothetical protein